MSDRFERDEDREERQVAGTATYQCDRCGEEIVVPIDVSAGCSQRYVEDCPVCCYPVVIHLEIDDAGDVQSWAEPESDYQ